MKNNNKPIVFAFRVTIEDYEAFEIWKNNNKIPTNSIALRKALIIAMKQGCV
jgi:hypothetical protein